MVFGCPRLQRRFFQICINIGDIFWIMLSLRFIIRKFSSTVTTIRRTTFRKPLQVDEPALIKLKKERNPDKLFHLFKANAHNRVVVENRFAFEDTVSRLAGARRFDYIEDLLEHQKSLPQGRREGFILRIIMLYGSAGMSKHAIDTFYNMHLYGCKRSVKSFNAALKVLAQSRDLFAIESFVSDSLLRFNVELDVYSFNIVLKAFCEMGVLEKACLVMVEMEKRGITLDVISYTTLIAAFYKENRPVIANGLWNVMVLRGCYPNLATFNVRIQFLVSKGRAWEANKLLLSMRRYKEFPDEVTYNLVIKGFFIAGFVEMAMRVYSAFHHKGYKTNQKIYQTMIHYLCAAGKLDLAYSMCKDSIQKNFFPSVHTIKNLLEGFRKDGKPESFNKAKYIYGLALKRVPPFSAAQVKDMKSILSGD